MVKVLNEGPRVLKANLTDSIIARESKLLSASSVTTAQLQTN
jgi:hypothetical protein